MCDLISRKMAIGAIEEMQMPIMRSKWESDQFKFSALAEVREIISELPSAQPERPEQPESAKEYCAECNHIEMCRWYPYEGCEFRSLPSAQPDLDEWCTDCKEYDDKRHCCPRWNRVIRQALKDCKWFGEIGCAIRIVDDSDKPKEDDNCSFAERRTDE